LIDQGIIPIFQWDQVWTRDLERLHKLPVKTCIMSPDGMTEMGRFRAVAGDRMVVLGDVPTPPLAAGRRDGVRNHMRDLVEILKGRGLTIGPGCDAPINARPETMEVVVKAVQQCDAIGD
jgi:uroporphyrinogen-III decarboxylase